MSEVFPGFNRAQARYEGMTPEDYGGHEPDDDCAYCIQATLAAMDEDDRIAKFEEEEQNK